MIGKHEYEIYSSEFRDIDLEKWIRKIENKKKERKKEKEYKESNIRIFQARHLLLIFHQK